MKVFEIEDELINELSDDTKAIFSKIDWNKIDIKNASALSLSWGFFVESRNAHQRYKSNAQENTMIFFSIIIIIFLCSIFKFGLGAALVGVLSVKTLFLCYAWMRERLTNRAFKVNKTLLKEHLTVLQEKFPSTDT